MIYENYCEIRKRIDEICEKSGRKKEDVMLLPVSKTKPIECLEELAEQGIQVFGENHVQEICEKKERHPEYDFHMIGHLQRNKVGKVISKVSLIHSVDSVRLAKEISKQAEKQNITASVLLEINVGNEESKTGFSFEECEESLKEILELPNLSVEGLMCVAPIQENPEMNRPLFRRMHDFLVDMNNKIVHTKPMSTLSMGMTNDFEIAVSEGATIVRVGTAIFGKREYKE